MNCLSRGIKLQLPGVNDLIPADSGWILESTKDIPDAGQIVGNRFLGRQARAFLLSPVETSGNSRPAPQ